MLGFKSTKHKLPYGLDYSDVQSNALDEALIVLPVNGAIRAAEMGPAKQQIAFSRLMAEGLFFTESDPGLAGTKRSKRDPEIKHPTQADGIARYLDRYTKPKRTARTIDDHPFALEMFPQELFSVMGVSKKKLLAVSKYRDNGGLKEYTVSGDDEAAAMLERLKNMADVEDAKNEDEDEEPEEDVDDEFDDDDDEDDYNAEKYFDDGDDDGGDDGDGDEAAF